MEFASRSTSLDKLNMVTAQRAMWGSDSGPRRGLQARYHSAWNPHIQHVVVVDPRVSELWTRGCLSSAHSSPMSQDIVHATNLGGGACRVSAVTSSTQSSWSTAARLSWPATMAFRSAGFSSSSGDLKKVGTRP